jgi:hypothetical protein
MAVFLLVYAPAVGLGFISHGFGWIAQSRVHSVSDGVALFGKNHGFYRPLVARSSAADYALFGNKPLGYGLTNFALCLLCAVLIATMFRAFGLTRSAAIFGAGPPPRDALPDMQPPCRGYEAVRLHYRDGHMMLSPQ